MEYGVQINNKFELFLDEDEDPLDILSKQQAVKVDTKTKKTTKEITKTATKNDKNAKPAKTTTQNKVLAPVQDLKAKPTSQSAPRKDAEKPPRFAARQNENDAQVRRTQENRPERQERREDVPANREFRERPERTDDNRGGRGGFNRRGGRGMPRGGTAGEGGFDRFGKRDFERHSGSDRTGLKPVEKKDGGGAYNWGTIKDDIVDQLNVSQVAENQEPTETTENAETQPGDQAAPLGADTEPASTEVPEPEERQLTLDEWKALQEQQRVKASFNIRKPGEGCADPKWKKMFVLKKKESDDEDENEEEEDEEIDDHRGKSKAHVPIAITFNDVARRGGGRRGAGPGRGRGRGRGERAEGGDRPPFQRREEAAAPNVDDERDFPSLG